MDRFFIKSHVWEMVNEKTKETDTENMGPWYKHSDVASLEKQVKDLKAGLKAIKQLSMGFGVYSDHALEACDPRCQAVMYKCEELLTPTSEDRTECEGSCDKHEGEINTFNVVDKKSGHDWGEFEYCDAAVKTDESRGMILTQQRNRIRNKCSNCKGTGDVSPIGGGPFKNNTCSECDGNDNG